MGANIKSLRTRIKSVDSTLHLTKAMGLVASSKIRKANLAMMKGREYATALKKSINLLCSSAECAKSPFLRPYNDSGATALVVVAGDRGLAGGYNANIFRLMREYPDADVFAIGKRSCERYGKPFVSSEKFSLSESNELAQKLCDAFLKGEYTRIGIVSTEYVSMMTQTATLNWLLPLEKGEDTESAGVVFEPDELTILNCAVKEYISGMIAVAVRESFACEVAARRMAMDSAGKNAQQMIDDLQLQYNRARQGAITQEITEIVAGSGS